MSSVSATRTGPRQWSATHDSDSELDWVFDADDWLLSSETIASHKIIIVTGDITQPQASSDDGPFTAQAADGTERTITKGVKVWVAGGTPGTTSVVTCRITTSAGRRQDFTLELAVT